MDILIKNITAAVLENGRYEAKKADVCVSGSTILSVGCVPDGFKPKKTIDGTDRLLIPGLINSHTHAYMTVFRNCADDLLFNDWLFGRIMPMEDRLTPEDCYWGTLLGCMEMLRSGTTAFLDMYIFTDSAARAVSECGMRAVLSRGLTGGQDDAAGGERRIREAREEIERWKGIDRLGFMLAPHAPYTCDPGYQREVAQEAKSLGVGIHTHISESLSEIETVREKYGCTPVELMDSAGLLTGKTVAAHCVQLTGGDIEILARRGVSVASNPASNLKLANGAAPVPRLMAAGVNVSIGTDGAASNNCLNMFRDMGYFALLHKGINHDPLAVTADDALKAATVNGARALGLGGVTGEIKPGLKADLAILNLNEVSMFPNNNPISALSYSCSGGEVETVIADGEILMENREFKTIDRERVMYEVSRICKRVGTETRL